MSHIRLIGSTELDSFFKDKKGGLKPPGKTYKKSI